MLEPVKFAIEIDFLGTGDFATYGVFEVNAGQKFMHAFEEPPPPHRSVSDESDDVVEPIQARLGV